MCDQQRLRSACSYSQSDQNLCKSLEYSMNVQLLAEQHLEFLSLKGGCTGWSESTLVKRPHCWKSHFTALFIEKQVLSPCNMSLDQTHSDQGFVCLFDSLRPSQQFFSYVAMGLPGLNQY